MRLRDAVIALAALFALSALPAAAQRRLNRAERDSVVCALATIWGDYLHNKADNKGSNGKFNEEYMRGLTEALGMSASPTPYFTGLQDGIVIDSRIKQIEKMAGFEVDREQLVKAFRRAAKGRSNGFTPATAERYMNYIITAATADNSFRERSEAFLDSIAMKPGVKKEMSGLLWEVITPSDGPKLPMNVEKVSIKYVGRLFDGTVFDEHYADRPVTYAVRELIPGFSEGLFIMPKGATYRFYLPPHIAYGEAGINGVIPPNAALVFDITLLEIDPQNNK